MFETLTIHEARSISLLKTAFRVLVGTYLVIGLIAGYRAYYQVHSLQFDVSEKVIHVGSVVNTRIISYARTPISVRLELIQGGHAEELSRQNVHDNDWAFLDPRPKQALQTTILTADMLGGFQEGPARLRVTALGRPQLSRTPPPVVREQQVEIRR